MQPKDKKKVDLTDRKRDLSLFLSCSVSLILISIFILIDKDKFTNSRASIKNPKPKIETKLKDTELESSCYEQNLNEMKEIALTPEQIYKIADVIKSGQIEIPTDIKTFLIRRDLCGYVTTRMEIPIKLDSELGYEQVIHNYLKFKHEINKLSQNVSLEVMLENV